MLRKMELMSTIIQIMLTIMGLMYAKVHKVKVKEKKKRKKINMIKGTFHSLFLTTQNV